MSDTAPVEDVEIDIGSVDKSMEGVETDCGDGDGKIPTPTQNQGMAERDYGVTMKVMELTMTTKSSRQLPGKGVGRMMTSISISLRTRYDSTLRIQMAVLTRLELLFHKGNNERSEPSASEDDKADDKDELDEEVDYGGRDDGDGEAEDDDEGDDEDEESDDEESNDGDRESTRYVESSLSLTLWDDWRW